MNSFLTTFSIKHSLSVLMIYLSLFILGVLSFFSVPLNYLPQIKNRKIIITTVYSGLPADEIRSLVTIPVENAVSPLQGLKNIHSVSRDGVSSVTVELQWGTDSELSLLSVKDFMDICYASLPSECEKPVVEFSMNEKTPSVLLCVVPKDLSLIECRYLSETVGIEYLQRCSDAGKINVYGGEKEEICVCVDRLSSYTKNISLFNLSNQIASFNVEGPFGSVIEGSKIYSCKTESLFLSLDEISNLAVSTEDGNIIFVRDIASVTRSVQRKKSFAFSDYGECVYFEIFCKDKGNPIRLSADVRKIIKEWNGKNLLKSKCYIFFDMSCDLKKSFLDLILALVFGALITFFVIYVFLHNLVISTAVSFVVPLCSFSSFVALYVFGRTLNVFSFLGIATATGIVVDAPLIASENIFNHYSKSKNLNDCIVNSIQEIKISSVCGAITTLAAFIPMFFVKGLVAELFLDVSITVIASVVTSVIIVFTYIPAVFTLLMKERNFIYERKACCKKLNKIYFNYLSNVSFTRVTYILMFFLMIMASVFIAFVVKKSLISSEKNRKNISYELLFSEDESLSSIQNKTTLMFSTLRNELPNVRFLVSGGIEDDDFMSLSKITASVSSVKVLFSGIKNQEEKDLIENIFSENKILFTEKDYFSPFCFLIDSTSKNAIISAESSNEASAKARDFVFNSEQIIPYRFSVENIFTPDKVKCSNYGFTSFDVSSCIKTSFDGLECSDFFENGKKIPVKVCYDDSNLLTLDKMDSLYILSDSRKIKLSSLGDISKKKSEKVFYRFNKKDSKVLTPPFKVPIESINQSELKDIAYECIKILLVELLLLYCILGAEFSNVFMPIFILIFIIPSILGALLFLFIFGMGLDVYSMLSLIVLSGTSVNNAIVFYEASLIKLSLKEKIIACKNKLNVILMTTLTSVFSLFPFVFIKNSGSSSFSVATIGGLLISFIVTVLIFPPFLNKRGSF